MMMLTWSDTDQGLKVNADLFVCRLLAVNLKFSIFINEDFVMIEPQAYNQTNQIASTSQDTLD